MNFIRGRQRIPDYSTFCDHLGKEHQYLIFHTEVPWLSRGKVLSRVAELVTQVAVLLREHGSVELATLFDNKRLQLKIFYLTDIFSLLNELSYSQLEKKQISDRGCREGLRLQNKVITMEKETKKPKFYNVFIVGQ